MERRRPDPVIDRRTFLVATVRCSSPRRAPPRLCRRLLRRSASESGRLCHGDGGHEGGAHRRRALMLPVLFTCSRERTDHVLPTVGR